ncbi:MAG: hypothetical protein NZL85_11785, partial [Fimbriimonadales bacterium]|nr:hypothetical protein [Fimbriimonadales bacterium]
HELVVIQILSEVELDPDLEGDLKLIDAETGEALEVTATSGVLAEYQKRLHAHCEAIVNTCRRIGALYLQVRNSQPVEEILLRGLRPMGILRD